MTKKGKKKNQRKKEKQGNSQKSEKAEDTSLKAAGSSSELSARETFVVAASGDIGSEEWTQQMRKKKQKSQEVSDAKRDNVDKVKTTVSQPSLQGAWAAKQQQQAKLGLSQQKQGARSQQQTPADLPQQQQEARRQKQTSVSLSQQEARGQQQALAGLLQQQQRVQGQQQTPAGFPQQQRAWGQQQAPAGLPQQQQRAWSQQQVPTSQQRQEAQSRQQASAGLPQQRAQGQQQAPADFPQQQDAWGQQKAPASLPQQQQGPWDQQQAPAGLPQQQQGACGQQQAPAGLPQQQQRAWSQQQVPTSQQRQEAQSRQQASAGLPQQRAQGQQQAPADFPQQQDAWGQQKAPASLPQQQQGPWDQQQAPAGLPQQQQGACGQQQAPAGLPQQQQRAWSQQQVPTSQQRQEAQSRQQASAGLPQQRAQGQQQAPASLPQQQQKAWGQQQAPAGLSQQQQGPWAQQQAPASLPQQQQGAWGQQQAPAGLSQQQQGAWGQQQAPAGLSQQQQGPWAQQQAPASLPQQQQRAWGQQQASTSQQQVGARSKPQLSQPQRTLQTQMSELSLRELLQTVKTTSKGKLSTSTQKEYQLVIPTRKNPYQAGTKGKPIRVLTNMFEIIFKENFVTTAVHYDVSFDRPASKAVCRKLFEIFRKGCCNNRYPAFDGRKNAFSAYDLPFGDYIEQYIIFDDENSKQVQTTQRKTEEARREKKFKIILKKVAVVDLSWIKNLRPGLDEANRDQTGIQVLDIILRHASESNALVTVGRSMFWEEDEKMLFDLGNGLSLKVGGFQSAVLGWKAHLNVDVANKAFLTCQNVIDIMSEFSRETSPTPAGVKWCAGYITKFLTNLKVVYQISPNTAKRTYRVNGLGPEASKHKFECNGSKISIQEYFSRFKGCNLAYPDLPCIWVGSKKTDNNVYLPAEFCKIAPGQVIHRKLSDIQTSAMIRRTATNAPTRQRNIQTTFKKLELNKSDVMNKEFHLSVDTIMKEVDARILTPPDLSYKMQVVRVNKGVWQLHRFYQAQNLFNGSWTVLNLCASRDRNNRMSVNDVEIYNFIELLKKTAPDVGMTIGDPQTPFGYMAPTKIDEITKFCDSKKNLALIIVVIPDHTDETYGKVKQITELKVGVLTQCIKAKTIKKYNVSTIKNILLKINSKRNGINHTFNTMPSCLKDANCMLVGADVTHPSPDSVNIPSIAAVASSHDKEAFQYNIELRLQEPKTEIIRDLEDIIRSQIKIYHERMKSLPKRIIYYRDGVSEGQLAQVMHSELAAIKRAAQSHRISNVEMTCLVVQKRHHIRLFPVRNEDSDDRNKNVKAGTIVDTGITHPNHIDFYLVSHASIQGTAKPTKYRCICNDSNFNEDQIEELTYYLCHMYARCTRAVSYPAPTYYAHLAAYRGRALIQGVDIRLDNLAAEQKKIELKMTELPMYFV